MKNTYSKKIVGFTLLEVLVALAILAISAMAISRQVANGLQLQHQLALKTTAQLIAENEVALVMLAEDWPPLGGSSRDVELANEEWRVKREVISTAEPLLRQITISVVMGERSEDVLMSLVAFRGRH